MTSRVCVDCAGQTQIVVGQDNIFEVILPQPSRSIPTGTITIKNIETALIFEGQEPIEISSAEPGRRSLLLAASPTRFLAGRQGIAWVVSDSIVWACRVSAYDTTTEITRAILAEALPAALPTGATAYLHFGYWAASLPVRTEPVAGCLIKVGYSPVSRVGDPTAGLTFLAAYVRQIFETGLTVQMLRDFISGSPSAPTSDAGLEPAISAGLDDLVRHLRTALAQDHLTEADIPAPSALRDAHRLFACAQLYAVTNRELHDSLRSEARYAADDALRFLWIDRDGTGKPGPGDTMNITGLRGRDLSFAHPKPAPRSRSFGGPWWW